jgi:antimicrobial peptide system SdpB family protein
MSRRFGIPHPWTFTIGLARSGIALATMATLAATPTDSLFRTLRGGAGAPSCEGVTSIGLFCLSGSGGRELATWLAVAILLVVASGWWPRFTAVPHWWITFSVFSGIAIPDGGDQLATVVTAALLPYCLLDPRRWHWSRDPVVTPAWRVAVAASALVAVKVQMSFLYFQAAVSKLPHPEWVDGTAIYYYLSAPNLGAPGWMDWALDAAYASGLVVALMTWVPLAIEMTLALTLLTRQAARLWVLAAGVMFHGAIALTMGLWTFSTIVISCLLIFTIPIGGELRFDRQRAHALWRRLRGGPQAPSTPATPPRKARPAREPVAAAPRGD